MKIVNFKQFIKMPEGTLFCKYQPCICDELCIKGESISELDYLYTNLITPPGLDEINNNIEIEFSLTRDGCFDFEQLYLVLSDDDSRKLVGLINNS